MTDTLEHKHETPTRTPRATDNNHPLVDLVKELRDETALLVRQEVLLARREIQEKINHVKRSMIAMVAGALTAAAGAWFILLAASNGLAAAFVEAGMAAEIAVWLAPLCVGLVVAIGGLLSLWGGQKSLKSESMKPRKTIQSLEETKEWAREKVTR